MPDAWQRAVGSLGIALAVAAAGCGAFGGESAELGGANPEAVASEHDGVVDSGAEPAADGGANSALGGGPRSQEADPYADLRPDVPPAGDPPPPPGGAQAGECPKQGKQDPAVGILSTPDLAALDRQVTVVAATLEGESPLALRIETLDGEPVRVKAQHFAGTPATTVARFVPDAAGRYRVVVGRAGKGLRCMTFGVAERPDPEPPAPQLIK